MQGRAFRPAVVAIALLPAVLVLPAVVPALAADANPPGTGVAGESARVATARAKALMRQRRFEPALVVLRRLVGRNPDRPNPRFLLGLAALGAAQKPEIADTAREALLDEAVGAFRFMLVDRPGLVRVRLELARAFFLKREDGLAREHFERVLAGKPDPAVAANVHRFLRTIRARKRWSSYAGAALAPDTNIGRGSDERTIYLRGITFRRGDESLPRSGVGLSVWGGGEYQHPMDRSLKLRFGGGLSRRVYPQLGFDRTFVFLHAGPRWLLDAETELSLLASARSLWRGVVRDFDEFGIRIEAPRRFGRRITASVLASWHERRHPHSTALDGPSMDLSVRTGFVATPVIRFNAGLGWGRDRPRAAVAKHFRHTRWWVQPGVSADLPRGITLEGSARWSWTGFDDSFGALTLSGEPRSDRSRVFGVSVNKRDWTLFGFSPRISLTLEQRESNTQGADYKRTGAELGAVRLF